MTGMDRNDKGVLGSTSGLNPLAWKTHPMLISRVAVPWLTLVDSSGHALKMGTLVHPWLVSRWHDPLCRPRER